MLTPPAIAEQLAARQGAHHQAADSAAPKVSFEFFPPKDAAGADRLDAVVDRLAPLKPAFVSVTYGAGGGARQRTLSSVRRIAARGDVVVAGHLTCAGAPRHEIDQVARAYWQAGVRRIVALRGDPPADGQAGADIPDGYGSAADLVAGLRKIADFDIAVAAYPECHPKAASPAADLDHLKAKLNAGASRAITQFFFDTDVFLRFLDRARTAGITAPIVPGILPVRSLAQVRRFAKLCGANLPGWLIALFEGLEDEPGTRETLAASVAAEQCRRLRAAGVADFHFYTLNRADPAVAVCRLLRAGR